MGMVEAISGGKRSSRFIKLLLPVVAAVFVCYLAHEHVVDKGVKVSIDHTEQTSTSTTTALDQLTDTLTMQNLQDTRRETTEMNDIPHNYYSGEKQELMLERNKS